jgi:O-antigen/teichoic acid export membrane protein
MAVDLPESQRAGPVNGAVIASKASIMVASKIFGAFSKIAAIIILVRLLDKEDFGLLSFALVTYLTVTKLSELGLSDSVFYFFGKYSTARRCYALMIARTLFLLGIAGGLLLLIIGAVTDANGYSVLGLFVPLTILALIELPTLPIQNALIAIDRTKHAALVNILFSLMFLVTVTTPAFGGQSIYVITYCLVGYGLFRLIVSALLFNRHFAPDSEALPQGLMREVFAYSIPLSVAQIMWKLNEFVDKYVVMFFLPVVAFAEYTVGSWEIPMVPTIAFTVASVMMPQLVSLHMRQDSESLLGLWNTSIKKVSLIVLPLMVLLVTIAQDLIVVLFSKDYMNAAWVFMVYSLVLFHRVGAYAAVLKAVNQTQVVTRWSVYTVVLNLCLSVPLVLWLGMIGAAIATLVAVAVTWIYVLHKIGDVLHVPLKRVFPFVFYTRVLVVAFAAAIPVLVLTMHVESSHGLGLIWKTLVYFASFGVLCAITGIVQRSDVLFMAELVGLRPRQAAPAVTVGNAPFRR